LKRTRLEEGAAGAAHTPGDTLVKVGEEVRKGGPEDCGVKPARSMQQKTEVVEAADWEGEESLTPVQGR
jgi:hypothetical protein